MFDFLKPVLAVAILLVLSPLILLFTAVKIAWRESEVVKRAIDSYINS